MIGTPVSFSNLNPDIPESDIKELCETIGPVVKTNKARNGKIFANFEKASDARKCVEKFHKRTFDGTPMIVELVVSGAAVASSNDKSSLFGTKLTSPPSGGGRGGGNTTFKVTLSSNPSFDGGGGGGLKGGKQFQKGGRVPKKKEPVTAEALDDDLDNYMAAKSK